MSIRWDVLKTNWMFSRRWRLCRLKEEVSIFCWCSFFWVLTENDSLSLFSVSQLCSWKLSDKTPTFVFDFILEGFVVGALPVGELSSAGPDRKQRMLKQCLAFCFTTNICRIQHRTADSSHDRVCTESSRRVEKVLDQNTSRSEGFVGHRSKNHPKRCSK